MYTYCCSESAKESCFSPRLTVLGLGTGGLHLGRAPFLHQMAKLPISLEEEKKMVKNNKNGEMEHFGTGKRVRTQEEGGNRAKRWQAAHYLCIYFVFWGTGGFGFFLYPIFMYCGTALLFPLSLMSNTAVSAATRGCNLT